MENEYYKELGRTIRNIRRSKNLSQDYMATKLGLSQNMYSKIELGKSKCNVYRFTLIFDLFKIDTLELEELGILYWIKPKDDLEGFGED